MKAREQLWEGEASLNKLSLCWGPAAQAGKGRGCRHPYGSAERDELGVEGRWERGPHSRCRVRAAVCVSPGLLVGMSPTGLETQHLPGGTETGNPSTALSQVLLGTEWHCHCNVFINCFIQRGMEPSALCGFIPLVKDSLAISDLL